jgi:hypothetical protein
VASLQNELLGLASRVGALAHERDKLLAQLAQKEVLIDEYAQCCAELRLIVGRKCAEIQALEHERMMCSSH